jgi:hypothetical protein
MTSIIFPDTGDIINSIREVVGREIEIHYTNSGVVCPTCSQDTLTGRSIDPFCITCGGEGYITTPVVASAIAHVRWTNAGNSYNSPAGKIDTGNCIVTLEYDATLPSIIKASDYFLVDDTKLYFIDYDLRGVKEINRIVVKLQEDPREQRD